jgi:hypothetical protein
MDQHFATADLKTLMDLQAVVVVVHHCNHKLVHPNHQHGQEVQGMSALLRTIAMGRLETDVSFHS